DLRAGQQIEFENTIIYIDDKEGEDGIKGVQIYTLSDPQTVAQDISAERGKLLVDKEKQLLIVRLFDCLVVDKKGAAEQQQDGDAGMPTRFFTQQLEFSFNYGKQANERRISTKAKYMKLTDLMGKIRLTKQLERDTTELEVELNQRIAFALSPIAFLLLGLPLAIRTSRRETSVGLFLSVILAGVFFLSIILCESLSSFPHLYPQYLLWLPNIIFQILGAVMTYRISQR
uniref:LptF/LptG family permease n=1 Tax=Victivallis vadensis TaxID=172901 RepID=UPI0001572BFD